MGLKFPSIAKLFERKTGIGTINGVYGPYCYLTDEKQIKMALDWQKDRENLIFLRDNLDCSVALDYNLAAAGVYTTLGLTEHNAKASGDNRATETLCAACLPVINCLSPYREADAICAIPPAPGKSWDLPTEIANRMAVACGKPDISSAIKFTSRKDSVKALPLDEKWKALEAAGLQVEKAAVNGKKIILVDDKYQSGTTAQFIASKLYAAGAPEVQGLFCVKTWRDTDNKR